MRKSMEKVKHIPLVLFCLYSAKALVLVPSVAEIGALAILAAVAGYIETKIYNKNLKALEDKVNSDLVKMNNELSELKKMSESLQTNVSSIKLAQNYRQGTR